MIEDDDEDEDEIESNKEGKMNPRKQGQTQ